MKFAPDKPAWIIDAQDTLDFRTEAMGDQLDSLLAEGRTMEQIHLTMNERLSNAAVVEEATNVRPPLPPHSWVIIGVSPCVWRSPKRHRLDDMHASKMYVIISRAWCRC